AHGRWKVQTAAYYYGFDDVHGREVIAYHWHPEEVPAVPFPHVHLGHGAVHAESLRVGLPLSHNALRPDLWDAHLPTGRIALEQVLRIAIDHFMVAPLRSDWREVFDRRLADFSKDRTWATWPREEPR